MIYYFSNIVYDSKIIKGREPYSSKAGENRTLYVSRTIGEKINIISTGNPKSLGFFRSKIDIITDKIKIKYMPVLNIFGFKYFSYVYFYLIFCIFNIKKNDKVIIYNATLVKIIPAIIMKIKGGEIIYEVEELNSSKETKNIMKKIIFKFCEYTLFYIGDKFIITSINLKKYLKENKKYLLNRGYRISNLNIRINNDSKTPIILYSGNLDKVRGVEVFLESLKYIKYKCKIIITGKGNLQYKVSNYNNQNKNIKYSYKGFLNSEKYTELLIESKICINPIISNSDFSEKSFPSKILTYLQFYNLVISSKEYNFNEYNAIDKYIYTYSNDSAYELSMKINYLLKKLEKISFYDLKRDIKSYYDKTEFKLKKFIID